MFKYIKKLIAKIFRKLWSFFLHGLLAILPIVITLGFFYLTLEMIKAWLRPIQRVQPAFLQAIPYSEILLAIAFILFIGFILKLFVFKSILHAIESIIFKMPLVKPVYIGVKQLIHAFSPTTQDQIAFKKVVIIEFPRNGIYSLGFLTTQVDSALAPRDDEDFYNIFIPTTPNPTTGYFIIVPESSIQTTHLTRQQAMAMIISGGIIQPKNHQQKFFKKNLE